MKRLMTAIIAMALVSPAFAFDSMAHSSWTLTNETALIKSDTSTNTICRVLTAVIVSTPSAAGSLLKIFSSSFTTGSMSTVTIIGLDVRGFYPFYDIQTKGLVYQTSTNSAGVNIIYKQ